SEWQGGGLSRRYAPDATATSWGRADNHFLSLRHMLRSNLFYNLNLSYQHNYGWGYYRKDNKVADFPGDEGIQPISSSSRGFSLGTTDGGYYSKDGKNYKKIYTTNGSINWQVDRHNFLKIGFEYKQHEYNTYSYPLIETEEWQRYKYTTAIRGANLSWNEYWAQMVEYWQNWDETYGTSKWRYPRADEITRYRDYTIKPLEAAVYVQDKVEMGEIILNAGLRLDIFKPNEKYIENTRIESYLLGSESNLKQAPIQYQLNPRLGFSFPISDRGAFHVAYGHFFQMPSFETMYSAPLRVLTPLQLEGDLLGNCTLDPERTISYEVGLQQGLGNDYAADLTLFYKDFRNQLGIEYITTVDAIGYSRYVNRDYGNVKGFTLAFEKLRRGIFSGGVDYTFQYAEGSASDPTFIQLVQVASRLGGDPVQFVERQIVPLNWDQRHTLNLTAIASVSGNWSASIIGTLGSGLPYTPKSVGEALFPDIEFNNAARKPMQWNMDFKAKKYFRFGDLRLAVFCNIDNLFDHLNHRSVYSTSGLASENAMIPELRAIRDTELMQEGLFTPHEIDTRPEYYSSPRHVQVGMEVQF
ncbi:TonB-dependent receptor, partial [candidate division KSB1 bacterium]|nr:TonB-dependent receptor [candidate division KSB1 bacterium]